jgi:hypothetical protein
MVSKQLLDEAARTNTSSDRLRELANQYPSLRGVIHANSACPRDLSKYLERLGREGLDPTMTARLKTIEKQSSSKGSGKNGSSARNGQSKKSKPRPTSKRPPRKRSVGRRVLIVLAVLVGVVVFAPDWVTSLVAWMGADGQEVTSEDADQTGTLVRPVPDDALSYDLVNTPSRNISCELKDDGAYCSVISREYLSKDLEDCSERLFSIAVSADDVHLACGEEYLGNVEDEVYGLQYGETTAQGNFACTAEPTGMTCWDQVSGRGFTVSVAKYDVF